MFQSDSIESLRDRIVTWRAAGARIGFVPTMGNLHAGHLRLIEVAREHCDRVVASIFVNPLQFGPNEDFARYPRTQAADCAALEGLNTDLVFMPDVATMYPHPLEQLTRVHVPLLGEILDGAHRPGHFEGVSTVVARLFNLVQPDVAVFGEKDWQQLAIIRRMVVDLGWPIDIIGVTTVREPDGLALSSRNGYLSAEERAQAPGLARVLDVMAERLRLGERDFATIERMAVEKLAAAGFRADYVSIRRLDLQLPVPSDVQLIILAAGWLGTTRLIDNRLVSLS
ncbi:MAG TPA: pantoate--beta-alanine ligase [Gammaproteobacteria bacterium]|jgi:pantoate--beta-alanine ligase|nr:pantoate--beta-alanine ligase [Gammaproteobacteria bacterium]